MANVWDLSKCPLNSDWMAWGRILNKVSPKKRLEMIADIESGKLDIATAQEKIFGEGGGKKE